MSKEQQVFRAQRTYNKWVANETLEDFALRYTGKSARKWSTPRVANTALGIVSFLALEAIGGAITLNYGFSNAFWAISTVCLIIFLSGLPVCYFAAKAGIDIDLLTRGAGFGYIGSTICSLIYASFTFIFFALEAAIMSMALNILFNVPLPIAYILSALVVIPLVTHGIARISLFQLWTQPIWLVLQFVPLFVVVSHNQHTLTDWINFAGVGNDQPVAFNLLMFGAASAVIFPLMAQNGEQVDFLRFLPKQHEGQKRWWASLVLAGPGWVIIGFVKLLVGSFLAVLALQHGVPAALAGDPTHMYKVAFDYITPNAWVALVLAGVFVIISQLKINVTNAYAGSIAWSNFFSRITHSHPGRIVWLFFNVCIALLLMELGLYHAFESILITFSALVLGWFGTLVADLTINWKLGLRPREIQFKRGHLYDINPVGVISMLLASGIGISAQLGAFTPQIKALAPFIAFFLPFFTAPLIAWLTKGRYYIARPEVILSSENINGYQQVQCSICENRFDTEDMSYCPFYNNTICSLCCALDSRCLDQCRPEANLKAQTLSFISALLPGKIVNRVNSATGHFLLLFVFINLLTLAVFSLTYATLQFESQHAMDVVYQAFWLLFFLLLIINGILIWLYVLAESSKKTAFDESRQQMLLLQQEVTAHQNTEQALQLAKEKADNANLAKSRYLSGVSHELRTPLNTVYGYAQLIERDNQLPDKVRNAARVITKNGEHITDIIEGLLEISKIEARKVDFLHKEVINSSTLINPLVESFVMQAKAKGIDFVYQCERSLPAYVSTDAKRIRQVLMNLLSNAIKFTQKGSVTFTVSYRNQVAKFTIIDTGIGIDEHNLQRIFEPFERVHSNASLYIPGTGLGLSISRLLTELLGGNISVSSVAGEGSTFVFSVLMPMVASPAFLMPERREIIAYKGPRKNLLIVDDEAEHRTLLCNLLAPLNFNLFEAHNAQLALEKLHEIHIDLFILDVSMPDMDGWTLAQQIVDAGIHSPIIMVSGNAIEDHRDEIRGKLHQYYLIKPVNFDDLLQKLGSALQLEWLYDDQPRLPGDHNADSDHATVSNTDLAIAKPSGEILQSLRKAAMIGHANGVQAVLDQLRKQANPPLAWITLIEQHLKHFNMPAILALIEEPS